MIEGIPFWLFAVGAATVLTVSFVSLIILGSRHAPSAQYARYDLLQIPVVRQLYTSRAFHAFAQAFFVVLFLLVIATGLFGVQQGGSNISTVLTWTYWWVLLVLFVLLFGKAWCWVCPWDALSGWLERLSMMRPHPLLSAGIPWPKSMRNLYPATVLFLGLTWLELGYGITTRPEFTAMIAMLMFFITFVPLLVFEKRSFCRYGCLVGRISGLYALFAPIELRARDRDICAHTCKTRDCYHGNEIADACPTSQYMGSMSKNTYCILCGECVQACPHDNIGLNVRWFGRDLLHNSPVRFDEAAMVIVMLAMSTFHGITMTPVWNDCIRWIESTLHLPFLLAFSLGMLGFLSALSAAYLFFVTLAHVVARAPEVSLRQLAIRYAYSFLPIALFYHFAHNSMHFFVEGGAIVPLLSDPFGWGWNLFGTASMEPGQLLPFPVVWTMMVLFILIGHVWSLVIGHRTAMQIYPSWRAAVRSELPLLAAMVGYSILSLWIIAQPMEMRTAM